MSREPPAKVLRQLRREVGYGCPVEGCRSPYLSWHHFDPPWAEGESHNPEGMIALCREHHDKADVGAFTNAQLRELKSKYASAPVSGRFDWMREGPMLVVAGTTFHLDQMVVLSYRGQPVIWLSRNDDGLLALNLGMLSQSAEPRLCLRENFWIAAGEPESFVSPPSGKHISAKYSNGDFVSITFHNVTWDQAVSRWPKIASRAEAWGASFPLTAVEIEFQIGGVPIGCRSGKPLQIEGATFDGMTTRSGLGAAIDLQ